MKSTINRRDFLKVGTTFSLALSGLPLALDKLTSQDQQDQRAPANVILLLFDTLSARHMSLYGYRRNTTPNMTAFAEKATVFHRHHSTANFTTPSTASLLTGLYPWKHRAFHLYGMVTPESLSTHLFKSLPSFYKFAYTQNPLASMLLYQMQEDIDLITEVRDTAVSGDLYSEQLIPQDAGVALWSELIIRGLENKTGLGSSLLFPIIDRYEHFSNLKLPSEAKDFPKGLPGNNKSMFFLLDQSVEGVEEQLSSLSNPFFAYLHFWPPHEPYSPKKEFIGLFNDGWEPETKPKTPFTENRSPEYLNRERELYDEYIAYVDSEFGKFTDFLGSSSLMENSYIILTSDHGQLFERGIHGHFTSTLYEPLIHVPLVIKTPNQQSRQDVHSLTSNIDLLPTLLNLAGEEIPASLDGSVLPSIGSSEAEESGRSIFSFEAKENPKQGKLEKYTIALIRESYKLIYYHGYEGIADHYELYDLQNDPDELVDLSATQSDLAGELLNQATLQIEERAP